MKDQSIDESPYHQRSPTAVVVINQNANPEKTARAYQDMFTRELWTFIRQQKKGSQESVDARIELHRRLALPFACVMLALVGIPLGASSRKGGRSAAYVWGIFLAFFCYYLGYIALTGLARSRSISAELGSWLPQRSLWSGGRVHDRADGDSRRSRSDWIGEAVLQRNCEPLFANLPQAENAEQRLRQLGSCCSS